MSVPNPSLISRDQSREVKSRSLGQVEVARASRSFARRPVDARVPTLQGGTHRIFLTLAELLVAKEPAVVFAFKPWGFEKKRIVPAGEFELPVGAPVLT